MFLGRTLSSPDHSQEGRLQHWPLPAEDIPRREKRRGLTAAFWLVVEVPRITCSVWLSLDCLRTVSRFAGAIKEFEKGPRPVSRTIFIFLSKSQLLTSLVVPQNGTSCSPGAVSPRRSRYSVLRTSSRSEVRKVSGTSFHVL